MNERRIHFPHSQPEAPARESLAGASGWENEAPFHPDTCPRLGGEALVQCPPLPLAEALRRFDREAVWGRCDTGRYRCSYFSWGEGPPLVFIPGLSDEARSFVLPCALLAEHFRCIAYNLPAGGEDGGRLGSTTHGDLVADLLALLDHLGIQRSYLFGSSFGSTIALAALATQPRRLVRAILQGGFAYRPLTGLEPVLAGFGRYLPGRAARLPFRQAFLRRLHFEPFAARDPALWKYFLARGKVPPLAALGHRAWLVHRLDLRPLLGQVHQPVLLVCGDGDPLVGKECEAALLAGLPNAGRVELSRCGHLPFFSHAEVLAEVIRQFLTPRPCPVEEGRPVS